VATGILQIELRAEEIERLQLAAELSKKTPAEWAEDVISAELRDIILPSLDNPNYTEVT
jgi:hypothetical protein